MLKRIDEYQITDLAGVVHLRTSDGQVVCGRSSSGWSKTLTELQRLGLVERCEDCSTKAPGLLYHVLSGEW